MLHTIKLLLPALVPSWRFFDFIVASPRIQFALLNESNDSRRQWQEFRPRPAHLPVSHMFGHMLWNPRWNESLFMVSCAERLMAFPTIHSEDEILARITRELMGKDSPVPIGSARYLQFRLMFVERKGSELNQEVRFVSRIQPLPTEARS